jgi:hypothetical protein
VPKVNGDKFDGENTGLDSKETRLCSEIAQPTESV